MQTHSACTRIYLYNDALRELIHTIKWQNLQNKSYAAINRTTLNSNQIFVLILWVFRNKRLSIPVYHITRRQVGLSAAGAMTFTRLAQLSLLFTLQLPVQIYLRN